MARTWGVDVLIQSDLAIFGPGERPPRRTPPSGGRQSSQDLLLHESQIHLPGSRGFIFRCVKWAALIGTLVLAFGPDSLKWPWLLASCVWPLVWIEWTRDSIRRKLPVAEWPRQLYL
jgi:hypothetical protein